jgi:hypothetical protein
VAGTVAASQAIDQTEAPSSQAAEIVARVVAVAAVAAPAAVSFPCIFVFRDRAITEQASAAYKGATVGSCVH